MLHRRQRQFTAMVLMGLGLALSTAGAATPVSPYKALNLPGAVNPTLHAAPVQAITIGPLSIQLEGTPLAIVQRQFSGDIQKAGDAANAVTWLCYAGKTGQTPVIYWFASNNEMAGAQHQLTQVAVQAIPDGRVPEGCGSAPPTLTGIDFGVPSIGATLDVLLKHFGAGKPDANGYLSYASELPAKAPKGATVTQSVQYRVHHGAVVIVSVSQVTAY